LRVVSEQAGNKVNGLLGSPVPEDLLPWEGTDLRKSVFCVVGVHGEDLFALRGAQNLDNFHELVHARLPREDGLAEHELCNDAADRPDVDVGAVVGVAEDELGRAVVAGADVADVGLTLDELLGRAKVAKLKHVGLCIAQNVLGLDVTVANTFSMDIGN